VIDNIVLVTVVPVFFFPALINYANLMPYLSNAAISFYHIAVVYYFPLALYSQTTSIWVVVLVAVNRYIAVCRPLQVLYLIL
jgi:hypothetical protein